MESPLTEAHKEILKNLDVADARVKQAIHVLKTTQVEASLRPANERPKTLHDFVDEKGVDQLTAAFRECIDNTSDAQNDFTDSNAAFDRVIQKIGEKIHSGTKVDPSYDYPELVTLFHSSEDHATEMANLLQSLVRHYDLCYKALKHTEGGDEAAQTLQEDLPDGVAVHGSPNRPATPQPISDEEKAEMMEVLDKDAEEVQDVVNEIRDRVLEMETHHEQIVNQEKVLETDHSVLVEVISMLEVVGSSLPQYVRASATFIGRWHEIKFRIDENMQEINGLRDFFAGFYRAYDGLLIEIARRKLTKGRIEKFVKESMSKVEAMLDEDLEEREAFKSEHGEYLPSDIWPDLGQPPAGYEIRRVDESGDRIPEIPTDIVQRAVIRNRR